MRQVNCYMWIYLWVFLQKKKDGLKTLYLKIHQGLPWKKWLYSNSLIIITIVIIACTAMAGNANIFCHYGDQAPELRSYHCWDGTRNFVPKSHICKQSAINTVYSITKWLQDRLCKPAVCLWRWSFLFLTPLNWGNARGEHDAVLPPSIFLPFILCLVYI